jgi:hypothetical protein
MLVGCYQLELLCQAEALLLLHRAVYTALLCTVLLPVGTFQSMFWQSCHISSISDALNTTQQLCSMACGKEIML